MASASFARQALKSIASRRVIFSFLMPVVPHTFVARSNHSASLAIRKHQQHTPLGRGLGTRTSRYTTARSAADSGSGGGSGGVRLGGSGGGAGEPKEPSGLASLWSTYLRLLEKQPILVKGVTCALLNAFGDVFSQVVVEADQPFNWRRLATFTGLGFVLVAPALHFWYLTLSKLVPYAGTAGALGRLAGDQLFFAPIFTSTFIAVLMTLEGHQADVPAKLKQDLWSVIKVNWMIWVPAQFINFRFVPQSLQVLAANGTALIWNTYLSWASHKSVEASHV